MGSSLERELLFVPLGGTEEIGMNFNLYGFGSPGEHFWIIIDVGITFGDDSTPGVEVIVPDPKFIEEKRKNLLGIILTHGHEDHIGALPYLWDRLRCPIFATPFTAALLRRKLEIVNRANNCEIVEIPLQGQLRLPPFSIELITLTHSMPEPNAIVIRTELGSVFHTGDWKFDPEPVVGEISDEVALKKLGDEGVLACVGDSTNVFVEGKSGSEASLLNSLSQLISETSGKVAVTCFASNVARLKTIFQAASTNKRVVVLVGRSLWRISAAARETGYLLDLPPFLEAADVQHLPDEEILYICTGSQGEARAALSRIARGNHPEITLGEGDSVIFSSRIIPGNELGIGRLQNKLVQKGINVITEHNESIHVSGHPARAELIKMYQLAKDCQVPETVLVKNGSVVKLAPGPATIINEVEVGRFSVEGTRLNPLNGEVVKARFRLIYNGTAVLTLIIDEDTNIVGKPKLTSHALMDEHESDYILETLISKLEKALVELDNEKRSDDKFVEEIARITVRRSFNETHGKKPLVTVHLFRI